MIRGGSWPCSFRGSAWLVGAASSRAGTAQGRSADFPAPLLSRLILIDVEGPGTFRTRLAGTDVCEDRGRELRGLLLEDIHEPEEFERVAAPFRRVVESWQPDLRRRRYRTAALVDHCYVRLALPLSDDGLKVTGLLLASERTPVAASAL